MKTVEFLFDVVSPFSYLASTRIEAIAADCDAAVTWRPIFLGGVMKATGNRPPASLPARAPYLATDLQRWARFYGVPFRFPEGFPANTLTAMRALVAEPEARWPELAHRLFQAHWGDGRDLSQPEVLTELVGPEAVERAADPAVKARLRALTDAAVDRGVFGAPTFFIDGEMFFGNDRLPFVEQALRDLD